MLSSLARNHGLDDSLTASTWCGCALAHLTADRLLPASRIKTALEAIAWRSEAANVIAHTGVFECLRKPGFSQLQYLHLPPSCCSLPRPHRHSPPAANGTQPAAPGATSRVAALPAQNIAPGRWRNAASPAAGRKASDSAARAIAICANPEPALPKKNGGLRPRPVCI